MDPNTPMTVAAASYKDRQEAVEAFKAIWGARHQNDFDHMALAVLTKDAQGQLEVERHDSTTKHLAWTGAALGGALTVVCPPAGIAVAAGAGAGIGAWIGHFWHTIPKADIRELGDLLDDGESAIFVVAVNRKQVDLAPLLLHPVKSKVVQTKAGDWEAVAERALGQAEKQKQSVASSS